MMSDHCVGSDGPEKLDVLPKPVNQTNPSLGVVVRRRAWTRISQTQLMT